jgi:putative oxidoreductase
MPDFVWKILLRRRVHGNAAWVAGVLRVVLGAVFTFVFAIDKFAQHGDNVHDFKRWDVPVASLSVYVAGLIELVFGLMLIFGVFTRLAALVLAGEMVIAILTAGRTDGFGFHTTVTPLFALLMLYLVYAGAGPVSIDRVLERSLAPQPDASGDGKRPDRPEPRAVRKARRLKQDPDVIDEGEPGSNPKLGKDWN